MYCKHCGADNNDTAEFCIKCGNKLYEGESPKKNPKKKLWLGLISIFILLIIGCSVYNKQGTSTSQHSAYSNVPNSPDYEETHDNEKIDDSDSQDYDETEEDPVKLENIVPNGTWNETTQSHSFGSTDWIKHDGIALFNFGDMTAVGANSYNDRISTAETEFGFIISVVDEDIVHVEFYNHGSTDVAPVKNVAERYVRDGIDNEGWTDYSIKGYSLCPDGYGRVTMTLSNGVSLCAGVFKENDKLYVMNISDDFSKVEQMLTYRGTMEDVLDEYQITTESKSTNIYYPIVPFNDSEVTDTQYWIDKSFEIVEPEWTDAHKVVAIYEYVIENFGYDYWVTNQDKTARFLVYNHYTSNRDYASNTYVGVCNDFADIITIMCRAQGIAATKVQSNKANHAWAYVYIKDYDRWMYVDATNSVRYKCYSENINEKKERDNYFSNKYKWFDQVGDNTYYLTDLTSINGNYEDMKKRNISLIGT